MADSQNDPLMERIQSAAFEWAVDYKPWEDDLEPGAYAEYGFIQGALWAKQNLILILGFHADGGCVKLGIVTKDFDLEAWAASRQDAFKLLNVVRLEIVEL